MWNDSPSALSPGPLLPFLSLFPRNSGETDVTNEAMGASTTYPVVPMQSESNGDLVMDHVGSVSADADESRINLPCQKTRSNAKRKVKDREPPTDKRSLTDMYSKRSANLIKKGEELAHFTRAYVLVFTARPESIGEGNSRLLVSDEFKNADPDLVARINKVTRELDEIALELAHRAGWDVQGRKKRRTGGSDGSAEVREHVRSSLSTTSTSNSATPSGSNSAMQNQTSTQLPRHIPNPAAPVPTKQTSVVTIPHTPRVFGVEQKKIESFVRALIKLPLDEDNLDVLHDIAQSEIGVRAIDNANAIPILIELLDKDPLALACRSAVILTSMMQHWMACVAVLRTGAVAPFIRLLSRDIGSEILKSISRAFGRCIPWRPGSFRYLERHDIPSDALGELSALLYTGNMEVRLAAARVIQGLASAKYWDFIKDGNDHGKGMALGLCRLVLDCRDLCEKEPVVSAISALRTRISFTTEIKDVINSDILSPLIHLFDDNNRETTIAACRILRKPLVLEDRRGGNGATLQHLTPLLSHPDDEIFVEAAWTASVLTWCDQWDTSLPESFPLTAITRLIRLLHHHEEHVVVCALHSISDARHPEYVLVDFLLRIEGGTSHIINLIESTNLDVAEAALLVVRSIQCMDPEVCPSRGSVLRYFLEHGVIQVLLRIMSCDSSRLFPLIAVVIAWFLSDLEWPLMISTTQDLIHLLPSLDNPAKMVIISVLYDPLQMDVDITLDPSIPRFLLQLCQDATNSPHFRQILELLHFVIIKCRELHEAFRAAGAESFLAGPQIQSRLLAEGAWLREQNQDSLDLLRIRDLDSDFSE